MSRIIEKKEEKINVMCGGVELSITFSTNAEIEWTEAAILSSVSTNQRKLLLWFKVIYIIMVCHQMVILKDHGYVCGPYVSNKTCKPIFLSLLV